MVEVSKKNLWKIVNKKINKLFDAFHVLAIINILFEEMAKDLFAGKRIIINNFIINY
jgi:nucleoid DNA-binding protein